MCSSNTRPVLVGLENLNGQSYILCINCSIRLLAHKVILPITRNIVKKSFSRFFFAFSSQITLDGAVEAIAGLLPVPLLLKRMATRSLGRLPPLLANHPLCALLSRRLARDMLPAHSASIANMSPALQRKTCGSLMEVDVTLSIMVNASDVFAPEAQPGYRLIDTWQESISSTTWRCGWRVQRCVAPHRLWSRLWFSNWALTIWIRCSSGGRRGHQLHWPNQQSLVRKKRRCPHERLTWTPSTGRL